MHIAKIEVSLQKTDIAYSSFCRYNRWGLFREWDEFDRYLVVPPGALDFDLGGDVRREELILRGKNRGYRPAIFKKF